MSRLTIVTPNRAQVVAVGRAKLSAINLIEKTVRVVMQSAGCAIGYEAAGMVLKGSGIPGRF